MRWGLEIVWMCGAMDGLIVEGIGWVGVGWDEQGWDGMGWVGMGRDGMEWEGKGRGREGICSQLQQQQSFRARFATHTHTSVFVVRSVIV